jgi:hypothetical protein
MASAMPEGWRVFSRTDWNDMYMDYLIYDLSLYRWKPARLSRFRKRIIPGNWVYFQNLWNGKARDFSNVAEVQAYSLAREIISLTEKDEARLGVTR